MEGKQSSCDKCKPMHQTLRIWEKLYNQLQKYGNTNLSKLI